MNTSAFTKMAVAALTAASLTLTSCMTTNPYTGQQETSKTTKGTAIGTIVGAGIGALVGNNRSGGKSRKYAIRGALAGAAIGGGIGKYMDNQEALIRQQLEGTGVSVTRSGNDLILNMPSDVTFKTAQSKLQPRFLATLDSVALVLKKYKKTQIAITGHTDSDGSAAYNKALSVSRANSVANYLSRSGIVGSRLLTSGRGESQPVASNNTAAGKAKNRRVTLHIVPQANQF